ncbi:MAG: S41 family peptidase [Clostridiales bacterium]|nr:S41 family peptidase [Clostridiales bacterium]
MKAPLLRGYFELKRISRKKHLFYKFGFFALLLSLAGLIYANYDYMVFKLLIADNYIFTDALDEWYEQSLGEGNFKGYHQDFDRAVIAAVTEKISSINKDRYTYLYTPAQYRLSRDVEKVDAAASKFEILSEKTIMVSLTNISSGTKDFFLSCMDQNKGYENLILDLRGNYGGLLADFYKISEQFTKRGAILGYEKTRIPFLTHAVKSKGKEELEYRKILILQDENTASAAEGLILSLKGNLDNVTAIGEKTFGKGIGQVTLPLTGGYAVKATVLLVSGPQDNTIHGIGIEPDVYYAGDDIVNFALEMAEAG